jgi:HEAT repeat protein
MRRSAIYFATAVSVVVCALVIIGCRPRKSEEPQTPPKPASPAPRVTTAPPPRVVEPSPSQSKTTSSSVVVTDPKLAAKEAAALEMDYLAKTNFAEKVEALYKISDLGTGDALDALMRLFLQEQDADMKIQVIDAMGDIEEFNEKKLALLTVAVKADQPQDVRSSAINALSDIEDSRVIPILQSLLNDPDEDIRTEAEDNMKLLQDTLDKAGAP